MPSPNAAPVKHGQQTGTATAPPPASSPSPQFFNEEKPVEIALLASGDAGGPSLADMKNALAESWRDEGLSVSTSLVRPAFSVRFADALASENLTGLARSGLGGRAECFCFLKIGAAQASRQSHSEGGETLGFESAAGRLELKFFALRAGSVRSFSVAATGAGGSRERALESLGSKLVSEIFNHKLPLSLCKK